MKKNNKFISLINKHINEISNFVKTELSDFKSTSIEKIAINCPYCNDHRKKYKLLINLDWNNFKCFKCGESGNLNKLFKKLNIYHSFINLLMTFSNLSYFDLITALKSNNISEINDNKAIEKTAMKEFITHNGLININKMKLAKKYALTRTYNNKEEIESYLADDKYIYIPITYDEEITGFMGRLYLDTNLFPRYIFHKIDENKPMIGFFDQVLNNFSTNSVYITEGYFDAYAINYAYTNYVSLCSFGSNKIHSVVNELTNKFPISTNIYLVLDSPNKDKNIYKHIFKFGDSLLDKFTNISVIVLPESDPSEILATYGIEKLKNILENNVINYLKYSIMNRNKV